MQTAVSGSTVPESIKDVKVIQCSRDSVHSPVISSSGCWWNITFPQVRIHIVLNSLQKLNSKLNANKRKGEKNIHYEQTWRVPTLLNVLKIPRTLDQLHILYRFRDGGTGDYILHYTQKEYSKLSRFFIQIFF